MSRWSIIFVAVIAAILLPNLAYCQPLNVTGIVILPDGKPASEATVRVLYPEDYGQVTADSSGQFVMKLEPGDYSLGAYLGTFIQDKYYGVNVCTDGSMSGCTTIRLEKGAMVAGKLVDKVTGRPLGGAKVFVDTGDTAETAADGSFALGPIQQVVHHLLAAKDGFAYVRLQFSAEGMEHVDLSLSTQPEAVLTGTVKDKAGNLIKGAVVHPEDYRFAVERTTTDENGKYILHGLDPDKIVALDARADGYDWDFRTSPVFSSSRQGVLDFILSSKNTGVRSITGKVTRPDGKPVAGARVSYGWSDCMEGFIETRTGEDGRYTLKDVNTEKNMVVAEADGLAPAFKCVPEKVSQEVNLIMQPGHSLSGQVVDEKGQPIDDVCISISVPTEEMSKMDIGQDYYRWANTRAKTDEEGKFEINSIPGGQIVTEFYAEGYSRIYDLPLDADKHDLVVTLKKPVKIQGMVLDAVTGKPISKLKIADIYGEDVEVNSTDGKFIYKSPYADSKTAIQLIFRAEGYLSAKWTNASTSVGKDSDGVIIRMQPSKAFAGLIFDAKTGKPIDGAVVRIIDTDKDTSSIEWSERFSGPLLIAGKSDSNGKFQVSTVSTRFGTLLVEKPGYARKLVRDVDMFKPIKVGLVTGSSIRGVATGEDGKPLSDARIAIDWSDRTYTDVSFRPDQIAPDGSFTISDLPSGKYLISMFGPSRVERMDYVQIGVGEDYTVNWNKKTDVKVECTVTHGQKPMEGVRLLAYQMGQSWYLAMGDTDKN